MVPVDKNKFRAVEKQDHDSHRYNLSFLQSSKRRSLGMKAERRIQSQHWSI